jgi:hypothetical protein
MSAFRQATAFGNEGYNGEKLLSIADELISDFRLSRGDKYRARSACRYRSVR